MKDHRKIFSEPKGFEAFVAKRQSMIVSAKSARNVSTNKIDDKENLTFAPDTAVSSKSKGLQDKRTIFREPKGTSKFIEKNKEALLRRKQKQDKMGIFFEYK